MLNCLQQKMATSSLSMSTVILQKLSELRMIQSRDEVEMKEDYGLFGKERHFDVNAGQYIQTSVLDEAIFHRRHRVSTRFELMLVKHLTDNQVVSFDEIKRFNALLLSENKGAEFRPEKLQLSLTESLRDDLDTSEFLKTVNEKIYAHGKPFLLTVLNVVPPIILSHDKGDNMRYVFHLHPFCEPFFVYLMALLFYGMNVHFRVGGLRKKMELSCSYDTYETKLVSYVAGTNQNLNIDVLTAKKTAEIENAAHAGQHHNVSK